MPASTRRPGWCPPPPGRARSRAGWRSRRGSPSVPPRVRRCTRVRPRGTKGVGCMSLRGEYEPSPWDWVNQTVEQYERTGGKEGATLEGKPVIILTTKGRRTGKLRKTPLMRVEHEGNYVVVG